MEFQQFFHYIHHGAFHVLDNIVVRLSNADRKSLRLVLSKSLSDAILPYMFERLYLSVHVEDLEVFEAIANHAVASRRVIQIFWNPTPGTQYYSQPELSDERFLGMHANRLRCGKAQSIFSFTPETQVIHYLRAQHRLQRQARDFLIKHEQCSIKNTCNDADLKMLSQYIPRLANLRRINIISEETGSCADLYGIDFGLWDTPRARRWKNLTFHHLLDDLRPRTYHNEIIASSRTSQALESFCRTTGSIGSLILEPFSHAHLLEAYENRKVSRAPSEDKIGYSWRGVGDSIPDTSRSQNLTVRLLRESTSNAHVEAGTDLWVGRTRDVFLPLLYRNSIEELSVCNSDISPMLIKDNGAIPRFVRICTSIRRLRLYNCPCDDMLQCLRMFWDETSIRDVQLHSVSTRRTSWFAILTTMREEGQMYDCFSVKNCRSPSELWGPEFGPEILAPWNGKSEDIVPWLRRDSDKFPLWQGPA